jgi:hypothetical protein
MKFWGRKPAVASATVVIPSATVYPGDTVHLAIGGGDWKDAEQVANKLRQWYEDAGVKHLYISWDADAPTSPHIVAVIRGRDR